MKTNNLMLESSSKPDRKAQLNQTIQPTPTYVSQSKQAAKPGLDSHSRNWRHRSIENTPEVESRQKRGGSLTAGRELNHSAVVASSKTAGQKLLTSYNNAALSVTAVGQQPAVTTSTGTVANIKRVSFCGNSVAFGVDSVLVPFKLPKLGKITL